ncbi:MAG: efflux RND transporter periplasmic adaptor subunit [Elusimicrobiota bacterium]
MVGNKHKPPVIIPVILVLGTAVYFLATHKWSADNTNITAAGTIEATQVDISSKIPGTITRLNFKEGEVVNKGVSLAEINHDELDARLAQVQAQAMAAMEQINQVEINLNNIKDNFKRTQELYTAGSVSQQQYDTVKTQYDTLQSQYSAAKQNYNQASAAVDVIKSQIGNAYFRSPIDGTIVDKPVSIGETLFPGTVLCSIADLDDVWLKIYVPSTKLGRITVGQSVEVTTDSFPNKKYEGKIINIATKAEFTPKNIQIKEERAKLVFAVKIGVQNIEQELKPGMPADAIIKLK